MVFFLFAPQHSRHKGCSWSKRSDCTKALSTLLVTLGDSFAGALSIQKRSTGGDWSRNPPDLDFLYVSTLQFSKSSWCHSTCRQGDLRGSTLHVLMAKPSPNLSLISSHVSTANLDSLTQMENGLTESGCYRCLSYISECSTRSTGQRPYMHRITRTFDCLYEVKNLLRLLSDRQ